MNRKVAAIWLSLAIIFGLVLILVEVAPIIKGSTIIYVDDEPGEGPGNPAENYTNIQMAIDSASDGDTIFVYNGTYNENLLVSKSINLTGENRNATIINGSGSARVVNIDQNWVNVTNFTITKGVSGIYLDGSSNCAINSNNFISINSSGIFLHSSSHNSITENNFFDNGIYIYGNQLSHCNSHEITTTNIVNDKPLYYYKDNNGFDIDGIPVGQVILANCSDIEIRNLNINHSSTAVSILFSTNINITNNNMSYNQNGILLRSSTNNNILNNEVSQNNCGIYLFLSSNKNTVSRNNLSNNGDGIILWSSSSNNRIINNTISSNIHWGLRLRLTSNNNKITNNNVSLNGWDGIFIDGSSNNIIISNNISNNGDGIYLSSYSSNNNLISENNVSSNDYSGIMFRTTINNNIIKNNISNNPYGIFFDSASYNNITFNNITNNIIEGIYFHSSSNNNMIAYNNISSHKPTGIHLRLSANNSIVNNYFFGDGIFIEGDKLFHYNTHDIPTNNIVNGKPVYFYKDFNNIIIDGGSIGQLIIVNCTNFEVKNLHLNYTDVGIEIAYSTGIKITDSNLSSNDRAAIHLYASTNINITDNVLSNNWVGIDLEASLNNITRNNFSDNRYGIWTDLSSNNLICHNNFLNNTVQAYDKSEGGNQWDNGYPLGGNYWSDYSGIDYYKGAYQDIPGYDQIGDTSYKNIEGSADEVDNYPLMEPYKSLENYTTLNQGWNLISIPLIQEDQNLTRVLGSIDGWYDTVQWYDISDKNDPWKHHKIGKPYGNDLFDLNENMGFWVHITRSGDTIFINNGTQPSENQTIVLHSGWNMVGYPSLRHHNRTEALNNLTFDTEIDGIWSFNAGAQTWENLGESDIFEVGKGYYIHAKSNCEWEVPL